MPDNRYQQYLKAVARPFKKLAKIEFLQPDNSVAFSLDNNSKRGYMTAYDSRAFIQSGTLSVSLQNGQRRKASITLANQDKAFDYAVNKIWFGQKIRLQMGIVLPDGTDFYLPQGVFYIQNPQTAFQPNQKTATYNLVDKWAYLDGSLFGRLDGSYEVPMFASDGETHTNIFDAMTKILHLSRIDYSDNAESLLQIDNVLPVFTSYYNDKTYEWKDGQQHGMLEVPYNVQGTGSFSDVLLELNTIIAGLIGYDMTGALRVEPSQDDISDTDKPILWNFTPENSLLCGINESMNNSEVYNDVKIIGQALKTGEIWGRASNFDNRSDTDINLIGRRILMDERSDYWNAEQCVELAKWQLKRKTVLQKSVTIQCGQLFHLNENRLISVKRTDKDGSPIEKHLIQSYSLPIGETGAMSINAVSVNDIDIDMTVTSSSDRGEWEEPEVEGDTMFLKQTYGATQSGSTLTLE